MSDMPSDLDAAVQAWEVDGAPRGFADRVMRAADDRERSAPARLRRGSFVAVVAMIAAAAALLVVAWPWGAPSSGSLDATARTTVALPSATAVAEPGSRLSWTAADGAVEVRQSVGRVFYRVERQSEFSVLTSLGRIDVEGTSFEVEIEPMRERSKTIASTAAGVAVAALVTITLYEGRVVVASDGGQRSLAPGEQARLRPGRAPEVVERETLAGLRRENDRLRSELDARRRPAASDDSPAAAREDEADGRGQEAPQTEQERINRCAVTINGGLACPMVDPSPDVLQRRADCGVVVYDRPAALESANVDFTALAELVDLDDRELAKLQDGSRAFHEFARTQFEGIFRELGGDPDLAAKLSATALSAEIDRILEREDPHYADYDRVSEWYAAVLAGREPPRRLEDMTAGERHAYLWTATGDLYEEFIADYVGPARAHELREATDGWEGNRGMQGVPECPED